MNKIIFSVAIALFMVSVAFALKTIYIDDTVKPDIEASFEDVVNLTSYSLKYSVDDSSIELNFSTEDNITFIFKPKQSLRNGAYLFSVYAKDEIGNTKEFKRIVIVNVVQTTIFPIEPMHGIGREKKFNITIGTSRPAVCRWNFINKDYSEMDSSSFSGETSAKLQHKILNREWKNIEQQSPDTIYVKCIDELGLLVEKTLAIGYDPTPPVISVSTNSPVIVYPPNGIINVESTDYSICFIDDKLFMGQSRPDILTYTKVPAHVISYDNNPRISNGDYRYRIQCENLAGSLSDVKTAAIKVNLADKLIISVESPKDYIKGELIYKITTNKEASGCTALLHKPDGSTKESALADSSDRTTHNLNFGALPDGNYIADFACAGGTETAEASKVFIADSTAPSKPIVNATSCSKDKLSLKFSAYDNQSGIKGYNYSVSGANVSVNWTFTAGNEKEITGLNMALEKTYSINAKSINNADTESIISTITFLFNPNITIACQEKNPPIVYLNVTNSTYGKVVAINCYDESGCDPLSIKYGKSNSSVCNATSSYSVPVRLFEPATFCWEAKDKWGNKASGSKPITFKTLGTSCANGILDGVESDIDCGGNCLGCAVGLNCNVHRDCSENWCSDGMCKKPLCNDTIKNGFESDVDCGGPSCAKCITGKQCAASSDCATNYCDLTQAVGICSASLCNDTIKNGLETDVDCGGSSCAKCEAGAGCSVGSDCISGSCKFSSCAESAKTFEQCAAESGIDPNDTNGDEDKDGVTNYQECLDGTNLTNKDTDGDSYSDGAEKKAGTNPLDELDFPAQSNFYRYLLLFLGLFILVLGIAFFYFFKAEPKSSIALAAIGGALLLFVIIDWLLFMIPRPVLLVIALAGILGAGYFINKNQEIIIGKLPRLFSKGKPRIEQGVQYPSAIEKIHVPEEKPSARELEATKTMMEMLKSQREERERKREMLFKKFSAPAKEQIKTEKRNIMMPIRKAAIIKKPLPREEKKQEPKRAEFERLAEISRKRAATERLPFMDRKEDAFTRLAGMAKSKAEEIFSKLPQLKREDKEKNKKKK